MEYRNSKLLSFLSEQGNLSKFSCPYTSQQNGHAKESIVTFLTQSVTCLSQPLV